MQRAPLFVCQQWSKPLSQTTIRVMPGETRRPYLPQTFTGAMLSGDKLPHQTAYAR